MSHFSDTSPFQGVREFTTPGGAYRFMRDGITTHVYKQRDGSAYVHCGIIRTPKTFTPAALYDAWTAE